jgi:hypothetical protein
MVNETENPVVTIEQDKMKELVSNITDKVTGDVTSKIRYETELRDAKNGFKYLVSDISSIEPYRDILPEDYKIVAETLTNIDKASLDDVNVASTSYNRILQVVSHISKLNTNTTKENKAQPVFNKQESVSETKRHTTPMFNTGGAVGGNVQYGDDDYPESNEELDRISKEGRVAHEIYPKAVAEYKRLGGTNKKIAIMNIYNEELDNYMKAIEEGDGYDSIQDLHDDVIELVKNGSRDVNAYHGENASNTLRYEDAISNLERAQKNVFRNIDQAKYIQKRLVQTTK